VKNFLFGAAGILVVAAGFPAPAKADLIFSLTQDGCTGTCGAGPFGTITVAQGVNNQTVTVTETLATGVEFIKTGAGNALEFNLLGDPNITIAGLTAGFSVGPAPQTASTFGTFDYSILCSGCGKGASSPLPGPLTFTTTDGSILTPLDFVGNAGGYFFASDVIGVNGNTGNVAALGPTSLPEPGTLAMFGVGLIGLIATRRKWTEAIG